MQLQLRRIWILLGLLLGMHVSATAQEVLVGDAAYLPRPTATFKQQPQALPSPLRTTTLSLPFFDDFSQESASPDTSLWAIHPTDNRRPGISIAKGHHPPSKGVVTFDGASFVGVKYDATLAAGLADTLASQPIDLSGRQPSDSVLLSFFVQRGGAGESPESFDSLVLYFDTTGNFEYTQVWALHGLGSAENTFQRYFVPLDSARYFHGAFRFKFVSYGSLNGELDQFHLDYVELGANRSALNTSLSDRSPLRFHASPIAPYTALPLKHIQRGVPMAGTRTIVSNAGDPAAGMDLSLSIDDPVGGNPFAGTTIVSASMPLLAGFAKDTINGAAFGSQAATMTNFGSIRLTATRVGGADAHAQNDTVRTVFGVDSVLALDDAVGDIGYGLTNARAFCQEFTIDRPDTIVAVWMHFAPSIHVSPTGVSTDLLGKGFRLVIWDSLEVDSSLSETSGGMNVDYGTKVNEFIRYQLITPVAVPAKFYVGMRQADGMPIGLGFDRSDSGKRIYFENANTEFQLSTNRGTLMIRPEFRVTGRPLAAHEPVEELPMAVRVAPNPAVGGAIGLIFETGTLLRSASCTLVDLQGRVMDEWALQQPLAEAELALARNLAAGVYWLRVQARGTDGQVRTTTLKVLFQGN